VAPFILIVPLLLVMYFLMIRPQQQRVRAQQQAIRSVQVGDEVVTAAGLIGTIVALDDEVVNLEIADGVEVRVARMAIGRRLSEADVVTTTGHDLADADAPTAALDDDEDDDELAEDDDLDEHDEEEDLLEAAADAEDDHEPIDLDQTGNGNGERRGPRGSA
jgi:preprotein translocase subunit YajC